MKQKYITICAGGVDIPAVLWGEPSGKLLLEVHGDLSNKEDDAIKILAEEAVKRGYQALSFDLPQHGERAGEDGYMCVPWNCVSDLAAVHQYACRLYGEISLFACSIGAYFSLLAYRNCTLRKSLFLSPVVNMEQVIKNMMLAFHVNEQCLQEERQILLPNGQMLDWAYYCYVKEHPAPSVWKSCMEILYGEKDDVTGWEELSSFAANHGAHVQVMEGGEHYFHTEEQLRVLRSWASKNLL